MEPTYFTLEEAINTILNNGVTPTELSHELGFSDTSMVYRYKTGKTKSTSATRAKIIYDNYNILLDDYTTVEHLMQKAKIEMDKGAKSVDVCSHLMDKLIVIASYKGSDLRQKLLRFIANHDTRS